MWEISVFVKPLIQHQHHSLIGHKSYFPQVFTFCMFFCLPLLPHEFILFSFHCIIFSDLQDKNFPTLHLWLVLLFFLCVGSCLHLWSCQCSFSFLFHHVIKNSPCSDRLILKCYFRKIWYNSYLSIFLSYWLSRQIKLTVHEIIDS